MKQLIQKRIITIYSQYDKWKNKTLIGGSYTFFELQKPIFVDGECVYEEKTLAEIRENVKNRAHYYGMKYSV